MFSIVKFTQQRPAKQLEIWHELKQFSTCLKFADLLREQGQNSLPQKMYNRILTEKAVYNFTRRKRFYVALDIVNRGLLPLAQVLQLFAFIYPAAYYDRLTAAFPAETTVDTNKVERIKIYTYLVENRSKNLTGHVGPKKQNLR